MSDAFVGGQTPTADMTLRKGVVHAVDDETKQVIYDLARRVAAIRPYQDRLAQWSERADGLYYAEQITAGGADLWPIIPPIPGRSHVSVNLPAAYVDIPAALQAV